MFNVSEDISQDLAGMEFIGQTIDHRHAGVRCKILNLVLAVSADHHQVDHSADHACAVFNGFCAPQLTIASGEVHH